MICFEGIIKTINQYAVCRRNRRIADVGKDAKNRTRSGDRGGDLETMDGRRGQPPRWSVRTRIIEAERKTENHPLKENPDRQNLRPVDIPVGLSFGSRSICSPAVVPKRKLRGRSHRSTRIGRVRLFAGLIGGGGGSRTRVRKQSGKGHYMLVPRFNFTVLISRGRDTQAAISFLSHLGTKRKSFRPARFMTLHLVPRAAD